MHTTSSCFGAFLAAGVVGGGSPAFFTVGVVLGMVAALLSLH